MKQCSSCAGNINEYIKCACSSCGALIHPTCLYKICQTTSSCPSCCVVGFQGFREAYEAEHLKPDFSKVLAVPIESECLADLNQTMAEATEKSKRNKIGIIRSNLKRAQITRDYEQFKREIFRMQPGNTTGNSPNICRIFKRLHGYLSSGVFILRDHTQLHDIMSVHCVYGEVNPGIEKAALEMVGGREELYKLLTFSLNNLLRLFERQLEILEKAVQSREKSQVGLDTELKTVSEMLSAVKARKGAREHNLENFSKACASLFIEPQTCIVCRDAEPDHLNAKCGHAYFCGSCISKCTRCPVCFVDVTTTIKICQDK